METKIKCLLVDDEGLALALLAKLLGETTDMEVVAQCQSPVRAVEILQSDTIDLLFLDIQMPVLSGTNLLRSISCKPLTIFTTAYSQYAAESYDLDAVDYLLKPYSVTRFHQAIDKARMALRLRVQTQEFGPVGHLSVKADRQWVKISLADILYVEGWKEYVKIFTTTGKVITLESLSKLETCLPAEHFLRVHKSFIVATKQVRHMDGHQLVLRNDIIIPVARARKQAVVALLFDNH